MNTPRSLRFFAFALAALTAALPLCADWKDDVGYTRLQQTFTTGVPTSVAAGVTQAEADDGAGNYYQPDFTNSEFTGKTLNNKSAGSGASGHATTVGAYFYGNSTSIMPATTALDSYDANGWLQADFLNANTYGLPKPESRSVQNHSWISASGNSDAVISNVNLHLDYAIDTDGFSCVVGAGNGFNTILPDLLCQSYHTLSVGLVNGNHTAGLTTKDGVGRMKPDLVAFESLTSFSTPQVSSAATLISEKLRNTYSASLVTADYPRLTKALLLAGAAKEPLASWNRADTSKPYDAVYGAGALNVFLAYRILSAGRQQPSTAAVVPESGWNVKSVRSSTSTANRTYYFDIPAGSISAHFSAALTWHRTINTNIFGSWSYSLANLDLRLYTVDAGTFNLSTQVDASLSTVDNVEHIYQNTLPPGRYALQVSSTSNTSTTYALAWRTSPTVTVAATTPTAREIDGSAAVFTLTRTGSTTSPLYVPLAWSGTAVAGTHYVAPATGVLIPAGSTTATVSITPIADSTAQGDRTVTLTVATDYSLSAGATPSATATIQDKPYDAWRFSHFTSDELADSAVSGDSADPDSDGLSNLLEYAFGADPKVSDASTHTPAAGLDSGLLTLTYIKPTSITDLTYAVEWSADLQSWSTGASVTETLSSTDNGNGTTTVVVRALSPLSITPRQFLRLRVTRP